MHFTHPLRESEPVCSIRRVSIQPIERQKTDKDTHWKQRLVPNEVYIGQWLMGFPKYEKHRQNTDKATLNLLVAEAGSETYCYWKYHKH